ncbi:MFS transporter [Planctomicrobium sp. SH668]|uniref:MFS transporter n=1 Tax=Planctomicrobium sp. SH668 TaxID=3448126 RepID=UPI003F5CA048
MSNTASRDDASGSIYKTAFWLVFTANVLLCVANTLTFRFAEFIKFLGGNEEITGGIVAAGLFASLVWRYFLGQALDRFGVRNVWLASVAAYLLGTGMQMFSTEITWLIYLARGIFVIGLASMYAASLSFVQGLAPPSRRTEVIGTYGASGFVGMIAGAQLGDWLFQISPNQTLLFQILFGIIFAMGVGHGVLAILMTRGTVHVRPSENSPTHTLILRYFPSSILIATVMMGIVFSVTTVFLTRYSTELGLTGLRVFFSVYAITAFLMRITAKNWSQIMGRHRMIVVGMLAHPVALLALLPVTEEWHFIPSAACIGFGQALMFPCVISLAAGAFPEQNRGTGTAITLAAIDLGTVLTAPIVGWSIDQFGFRVMYISVSLVVLGTVAAYVYAKWNAVDSDIVPKAERVRRAQLGKRNRAAQTGHTVAPAMDPVPAGQLSAAKDVPVKTVIQVG